MMIRKIEVSIFFGLVGIHVSNQVAFLFFSFLFFVCDSYQVRMSILSDLKNEFVFQSQFSIAIICSVLHSF